MPIDVCVGEKREKGWKTGGRERERETCNWKKLPAWFGSFTMKMGCLPGASKVVLKVEPFTAMQVTWTTDFSLLFKREKNYGSHDYIKCCVNNMVNFQSVICTYSENVRYFAGAWLTLSMTPRTTICQIHFLIRQLHVHVTFFLWPFFIFFFYQFLA